MPADIQEINVLITKNSCLLLKTASHNPGPGSPSDGWGKGFPERQCGQERGSGKPDITGTC